MTTRAELQAGRTFPVVEVFGPTIQGEGPLAGLSTHFVRFGLCDFRCSWCDSMFAVDPVLVKEHAEQLTSAAIAERVAALGGQPAWVTLSGGNPAMHKLERFVDDLHALDLLVAVETQGSVWNDWLYTVQQLIVSPKPPSSGMVSAKHTQQLERFLDRANGVRHVACKIVVFDDDDYEWARDTFDYVRSNVRGTELFLSVGTDIPNVLPEIAALTVSTEQARHDIGVRMAWLYEKVAADPAMRDVRVFPQLHVLAWGHARAV